MWYQGTALAQATISLCPSASQLLLTSPCVSLVNGSLFRNAVLGVALFWLSLAWDSGDQGDHSTFLLVTFFWITTHGLGQDGGQTGTGPLL